MPYSGPTDDTLPEHVQAMAEPTRRQWIAVFNSTFEACDGEDCEGMAMRMANGAVKNGDYGEPMMPIMQLSQEAANYDPLGGTATEACANCQWFCAPPGCHVVQGMPYPISPTGRSDLWRSKEGAAGPMEVPMGIPHSDETEKDHRPVLWDALKGRLRGLFAPRSPVAPTSSFALYKDTAGGWRWVAVVSNAFRDHDNPPEIITESAHKDYIKYVDETGNYPEAWLWHTPGTRWGTADWAEFSDGFLLMSGVVDAGKEAVAEALANDTTLGVSHGFQAAYSDAKDGLIGWYRTFELSPLPLVAAANPWTSMDVVRKELGMGFDARKRAWLADKLGEDAVTALEKDTSGLKATLDAAGVEYKDMPPDEPAVNTDAIGAAMTKALAETVLPSINAIAEQIAGVKAVTDQMPDVLARLDKLEKSDDEKVAEQFTARIQDTANKGFRASEANETKIGEQDELAKAGPDLAWMEKAATAALRR